MTARLPEDSPSLNPDALLAAVVRYLIVKGHPEAARHLAMAGVTLTYVRQAPHPLRALVTLEGGAEVFDYLNRIKSASDDPFLDEEDREDAKTWCTLVHAFEHVLPPGTGLGDVELRLIVTEVAEGWRTDIVRELDGQGGHNQGVAIAGAECLTWRGLRFRSLSELKVAEALDRARVFFLPNCRARLGTGKRGNLEPDFLICHRGKWGILEVDGEPFHPPARTVHDHQRDRAFLNHGVKLVQHYDATRCRNEPDAVVAEFLSLLERVAAA